MPPWLASILVSTFEFFGKEIPVWLSGTPAPPPPEGKKPAFNDVDAKVDADRAKQREASSSKP